MTRRTMAWTLVLVTLQIGCHWSGKPGPGDDTEPVRGWLPPHTPIASPSTSGDSLLRRILLSPCDEVPPQPGVAEALTGGASFENEVHDCQRLVVGQRFGPLVGVFPIDRAMNLTLASFRNTRGVAVATVFNWSDPRDPRSRYIPLGIRNNWQCLWLRNTTGRSDGWEGGITVTSVPCTSPGADPPTYWTFDVVFTPPPAADAPYRFPASARWGWDFTARAHYIGIRCADGWCSVGQQGLRPARSALAATIGVPFPTGWYDEQHLAVEGPEGLVPGPWGIIQPSDRLVESAQAIETSDATAAQLAAQQYDALFLAQSFRAASIAIEGENATDVGPYASKFNLAFVDGVGSSNVDLHVGSAPRAWYDNGVSRLPTLKVDYLPSTMHAARGSVRWRWRDTDETAWVSCRSGCCDVPDL